MNSYNSTRNKNSQLTASQAILKGLAPEGGLYIIDDFDDRQIDISELINKSYQQQASIILGKLLSDYSQQELEECIRQAYDTKFSDKQITPLQAVGDDYVLELFHGPTSAFKDIALCLLPQLIKVARKKNRVEETITILTATSGDTGKAALAGFEDVEGTEMMVFYPYNGVSAVQKMQMVTQTGSNVHVCGVRGNFDDCQRNVKEILASHEHDELLNKKKRILSSANSINVGRFTPQVVYYFTAYCELVKNQVINLGEKINFVVPTGNFGNILAGYFAKQMGLPIAKLICASNENNVLTDFIQTGVYNVHRTFKKTNSPSMDILISSNLERLLYLLSDAETIDYLMKQLQEKGSYQVDESIFTQINQSFYAGYATQNETLKTIHSVYEKNNYLMDTHTAVATKVCEDFKAEQINEHKCIILATASPYKFVGDVLKGIGEDTSLNEFESMKKLNEITKVEIPTNLQKLDEMPIRHKQLVEIENMAAYVFGVIDHD